MKMPEPMQMEIKIDEDSRDLIERFLRLKESETGKPDESSDSIKLSLSKSQARSISEILWETQDRGPKGAGWASPELEELRSIVDSAIKENDEI